MKRLVGFLLAISFMFVSASCKKSDGSNPVNIGVGGSGNVTFAVAIVQDNQQQLFFDFKPSTSVVLTKMTGNCPAANVNNDVIQGDGTTVYSSNNPIYVGPLTVVQSGQQWSFRFEGKIGNAQGQAYDVTTNYTVP